MKKAGLKKRNIKIGPIGEAILGILVAGTLVTTVAMFPGIVHIIAPFIKKKKYLPKQAISKNLESLIKSGLVIQTKNAEGKISLQLSKKGVWEAMLRHHTLPTRKKENRDWDGMWRVVIFDVPNVKNTQRSDLRRAMRMYGFKPLQKSAWVYPFECDNFIALLKSHLGVSHDVLYMKVSYIENDRYLRKEFLL